MIQDLWFSCDLIDIYIKHGFFCELDGAVKEYAKSSVQNCSPPTGYILLAYSKNALEILQFCTKPSISPWQYYGINGVATVLH